MSDPDSQAPAATPHDAQCPMWVTTFDPATGLGEISEICTCRDELGHRPEEPEMSDQPADPARRGAYYTETLDAAARRACTTYLKGVGAFDDTRWQHQQYDNLTDHGKSIWRAIVTRAVYDMLPVIRDVDGIEENHA